MNKEKTFQGYIDNPHIANTFLIPIYKDAELKELYFHELNKDNKKISGFRTFDNLTYKRDNLVKVYLEHPNEVKIGDEPFFVVKLRDSIKFGKYSEILEVLIQAILKKELTSKILINQIQNIFVDSFNLALKRNTLDVFSSLKGVSKVRINDYLREVTHKRLLDIVFEKDKQFIKFYEDIVQTKNKRELTIPENVIIKVYKDANRIMFTHGHSEYNLEADAKFNFDIWSSDSFHANPLSQKVWKIKSTSHSEPIYLSSKSDQCFAVFVKELSKHLDLSSAEENEPKATLRRRLVPSKNNSSS